jgi:hypothetical protein
MTDDNMPSRVERLRAMSTARFAARRAMPVTVCPFPVDTPAGRVLADIWVREYLRHRPEATDAVDHTG